MFNPYELFIGLRYMRAKRRNHFISFISLTSVLGVALGVTALITVLSVMNGFHKELTDRTLSMASHATVLERNENLSNWRIIAEQVESHPEVAGVAPYFRAEGMLVNDKQVSGTIIRGILPEEEIKVSEISEKIIEGELANLKPGEFGIVLGKELSRSLHVLTGSKVTLVAPQANITPAGILPRLKRFTVVGIFEVGMQEFDSALALIHLDDAQKLFRKTSPNGLRIKTTDIMRAPIISREVMKQIPGQYWIMDWTQRHANLFHALRTEKIVMFVILTLIVAVAAFNIISTLVMTVTDKQTDIAVLRTLGASPLSIMLIFMIQGTVIGVIGTILGVAGGVWLASNVEWIVQSIEQAFNVDFLNENVYYISTLPSELKWEDVTIISVVAFLFSLLSTIYPARQAANMQPAEALRYE
ncbi:MAG: lipoprotein-releasing ABC transporter permease subunit [Gammaproteobacteria bacterium]|nr:lipoprotein-releasing ABC transporter permease subunit [Rhodospirillales bacterium]MBT7951293.1 lipoprotein-releasing ABC transporter permease subunit [Gammaproteobacteria bacterium]